VEDSVALRVFVTVFASDEDAMMAIESSELRFLQRQGERRQGEGEEKKN